MFRPISDFDLQCDIESSVPVAETRLDGEMRIFQSSKLNKTLRSILLIGQIHLHHKGMFKSNITRCNM